jgi:membrane dipeptidase
MHRSLVPPVTQALLSAGYGEAERAKIWSGNVLRSLAAGEAGPARPATAPAG